MSNAVLSTTKSSADRLVGNFGSFIMSGDLTIPVELNISTIVAVEDGTTITSIRLESLSGIEKKYAFGVFDWDGQTMSIGDICEIPIGYRVKSLNISSGKVKCIMSREFELTDI